VRIAVTGAAGFLGQHVRVALRAGGEHEAVPIDRAIFEDPERLDAALWGADAVVHLAGVNRGQPEVVEQANGALADRLAQTLSQLPDPPKGIVYANSAQAGNDTPYGRGKQRAGEILAEWADKAGSTLLDMRLCNVFGERSRPFYNTVVGTFCHQLAVGETPRILEDRTVNLVHAQDIAARIIGELDDLGTSREVMTIGWPLAVSDLLARLEEMHRIYTEHHGRFPDLSHPFDLDLFNTYRSYLFPSRYPRSLRSNRDPRGNFVELNQSAGGEAQTSFSTTMPGVTRGEHYHLRKIERFVVLSGEATIGIRPVLNDQVTTYRVSGDEPVFIDVPTLCAHNITNVGDSVLYTAFWTNEIFDPDRPDTYREAVG
jgi:UDP-2-acetamido-2,6-beta-L-arabino-hexul-4-ose reductase